MIVKKCNLEIKQFNYIMDENIYVDNDELLDVKDTSFPEEDFDITYSREICDIYNFLHYKIPYLFENINLRIFLDFINGPEKYSTYMICTNNFFKWFNDNDGELEAISFHINKIKTIQKLNIVQFLYSYANI